MRSTDARSNAPGAADAVIHERVRFRGPCGDLNGELAYAESGTPAFTALIVPPHPYMGGTMEHVLVRSLASELAKSDGAALRFDFSGVGDGSGRAIDLAASMTAFWETGHAPEDPQRLRDTIAALEYVHRVAPVPLVLAGYSFGCYAALRAWCRVRPDRTRAIVLISPTVARHGFDALDLRDAPPILVVHSDNDFATPAQAVRRWFDSLPQPKALWCSTGGDHFFRGSESIIVRRCVAFVQSAPRPVLVG